jgi:hypothetical protein
MESLFARVGHFMISQRGLFVESSVAVLTLVVPYFKMHILKMFCVAGLSTKYHFAYLTTDI